ncbi:MAG TPA: hypothetical protein VJ785_03020 [Anaerolineales bacterium]|nr:hypothetical protein [Anaerolineales bacterium]
MKQIITSFLLLVLLSACASSVSRTPPADEVSPTPYPDTPSPARIDAEPLEAPALIELNMLNELDGWGVSETEIVRTNDGGITWYDVTPPDMDETGYSVDTYFLDTDHAWVQKPDFEHFPNSGLIYRTDDGGLTWTSFSVPFSRGDISFVDAENGWMLADLGVGAGSNAVAVYQTTTGGAVWDRTYTNDPNDAHAGDSLPLGGLKSDLVALDRDTAWVMGVVYAPGEVYLHRSDDGGRTWAPVTVELPPGAENFELGIDDDQMKFVSKVDGFLALRMSGDSTQTAVYHIRDAGDSWTLTPTIIAGAGPSSFLSEQDAVIYNGEQFYVTRDAARTWNAISPDIAFGETFADMEFVDTLSGWVITLDPADNHRSLYRTQDGGSTWFPVNP